MNQGDLKIEREHKYYYVKLANDPYYEDARVVRCDCFLLGDDGKSVDPPALIEFATAPRVIHHELPNWHAGQVLRMAPGFFVWKDEKQQSGRCHLQLYITLSREGGDDFLAGMIPLNPDLDEILSET